MKRQRTEIREQRTGQRPLLMFAVLAVSVSLRAQQIQLGPGDSGAAAKKQHVVLLSDSIQVAGGSVQTVELRFRVDSGFHINSHAPKDELLIPTTLKLDEADGLKVMGEDYPAGSAFKIGSGKDTQLLDVYQGEFLVKLRVVVPRGASAMTGTLRYQACDNAACFPPRSLPLKIVLTGK